MNTPSTSKGHPCGRCKRSFSTAIRLKDHRRIHRTKSHICSKCSRGFTQGYLLVRHLRICLYPHLCPLEDCSLQFSGKTQFLHHCSEHTCCYQCPLCTVTFALRSSVKEHVHEVHQSILDPKKILNVIEPNPTSKSRAAAALCCRIIRCAVIEQVAGAD